MIYTIRQPIAAKLTELLETADSERWGKGTKVKVLSELLRIVDDNSTEDLVARKVIELEPIMAGCSIGKNNYYCGHCKTRVKQHDKYCRGCGFRFQEG